ncbi:hypothetical protein J2741_000692 [Methanolinea mesophila]|uniref:PEGA domain-containing protein n=1 Tax=Methanolinea mesophila TaxID=547055 RepID=UPI001AE863BA|nr:PEGA domain-containing protein [Methanolinea mesophila]MBP1928145.1 hypothetical protein [Methanolinea mesophila]
MARLHIPSGAREKDARGSTSRERIFLQVSAGVLLLLLSLGGSAASASDVAGIILPDYHHIDITLAHNAGSNYIKFDGGGLNALHLTTSPSEPYGQVTTTQSESGTFYVSDTGGRGFFDDLILMVAVRGDVPDDYSVRIRASGYRWTPTPVLNMPPTADNVSYAYASIDDTFTASDFIYGPQSWRPYNGPDYPFYNGQDLSASDETFRFMFIDLNVGAIGPNSQLPGLTDNGMAKIEYQITGEPCFTVFNVYGWCNQSNQGKGISWTNDVDGLSQSGVSGYSVLPPEAASTGGDQAGSTDSTANFEKGTVVNGYDGTTLAQGEPSLVNGSVLLFVSESPAATLDGLKSAEFPFNVTLPQGVRAQDGFLALYATGGKDTTSGRGVLPDLDVAFDGTTITALRTYRDTAGGTDGTVAATWIYSLPPELTSGRHVLAVKNRNTGTKITIPGAVMAVFPKDDSGTVSLVSFTEGCDILRAEPTGIGEVSTTSVFRDGTVPGRPDRVTLYLVNTGTFPLVSSPFRFYFNREAVNTTSTGTPGPVEIRTFDVTGLAQPSMNSLSVSVVPTDQKERSYTETRNAILVFSYAPKHQQAGAPASDPDIVVAEETPIPTTALPATTATPGATSTPATSPEDPDGGIFGMLPGPVRDFLDGIFGAIFAIGGVESAAPGTGAGMVVQAGGNPDPTSGERGVDLRDDSPVAAISDTVPEDDSAGTVAAGNPPSVADDDPGNQETLIVSEPGDQWVSGAAAPSSPYGGIYIKSIPGGAGITIDGKALNADTPKAVFGLREGSHTVRISNDKGLFSVTDQQVWVYRGLISIAAFDTAPGMKKSVQVVSEVYPGDQFTLNGRYPAYKIPAGITLRKSGSYLTVLHDGHYISREISDFLNAGGTVEIRPSATSYGTLAVSSDPAGADVLVDGFPYPEKTPCTVENLSEGRHTISVSILGYIPGEQTVTVLDDPSEQIDGEVMLRLSPYACGELSVESTPPGASVQINKVNSRQTTPCVFPYMTIGSYAMTVSYGGKVKNVEFDITPDTRIEYVFDFDKDTFLHRSVRM